MATPHTFENSLRIHDEAIFTWLDTLLIDYRLSDGPPPVIIPEEPILRITAAPSRPFADVAALLVARNFFHGMGLTPEQMTTMAEDEFHKIMPLPIITIYRADPVEDPELAGAPKEFRRAVIDAAGGKYISYPWPAHYRTEYTMTIWCEEKYTEAFILEWFYAQFGT